MFSQEKAFSKRLMSNSVPEIWCWYFEFAPFPFWMETIKLSDEYLQIWSIDKVNQPYLKFVNVTDGVRFNTSVGLIKIVNNNLICIICIFKNISY